MYLNLKKKVVLARPREVGALSIIVQLYRSMKAMKLPSTNSKRSMLLNLKRTRSSEMNIEPRLRENFSEILSPTPQCQNSHSGSLLIDQFNIDLFTHYYTANATCGNIHTSLDVLSDLFLPIRKNCGWILHLIFFFSISFPSTMPVYSLQVFLVLS